MDFIIQLWESISSFLKALCFDEPWVSYGDSAFVASAMALNFASVHWEPMHKWMTKKNQSWEAEILDEVNSLIDSDSCPETAKDVWEDTRDELKKMPKETLLELEKSWRKHKRLAHVTSFVSLLMLYLGCSGALTALIIVPMPLHMLKSWFYIKGQRNKVKAAWKKSQNTSDHLNEVAQKKKTKDSIESLTQPKND